VKKGEDKGWMALWKKKDSFFDATFPQNSSIFNPKALPQLVLFPPQKRLLKCGEVFRKGCGKVKENG
jgi:hypothetical protein